MTGQTPIIQWGRRNGVSFCAGDAQVTPESWIVLVTLGPLRYVWNWPLGVSVVRSGQLWRLPIVDVTRIALWLCWAVMLAAAIMSLAASLAAPLAASPNGELRQDKSR